jgi:hypothetical protein
LKRVLLSENGESLKILQTLDVLHADPRLSEESLIRRHPLGSVAERIQEKNVCTGYHTYT